jgi:hypothetical protein
MNQQTFLLESDLVRVLASALLELRQNDAHGALVRAVDWTGELHRPGEPAMFPVQMDRALAEQIINAMDGAGQLYSWIGTGINPQEITSRLETWLHALRALNDLDE